MIVPMRAGETLADHADFVARYCQSLKQSAEFASSLKNARGHLTMTHIDLHSARLAIARAKDAVDDIAAAADAYVKEPAA